MKNECFVQNVWFGLDLYEHDEEFVCCFVLFKIICFYGIDVLWFTKSFDCVFFVFFFASIYKQIDMNQFLEFEVFD